MATAKAETALVTLGAEETALLAGDLSKLSEPQRAALVAAICRSLGLNPLTNPFRYIFLSGKLTLYATKDATDQLRRIYRVSTRIVGREMLPGEIYAVTAQALLPDGRTEERIGAVSFAGLKGEALANALMKSETKAVRRVTLGACGLGYLDETEVESIPGAYAVREDAPRPIRALAPRTVNTETGEVLEQDRTPLARLQEADARMRKLFYLPLVVNAAWDDAAIEEQLRLVDGLRLTCKARRGGLVTGADADRIRALWGHLFLPADMPVLEPAALHAEAAAAYIAYLGTHAPDEEPDAPAPQRAIPAVPDHVDPADASLPF